MNDDKKSIIIRRPVCIDDFELIARSKLPKSVYDYYRSGADDELSLNRNVEAYKKLLIRPKFLRDVSNIDTNVSLLNGTVKLKSPICIAATASQKMSHHDGELATSRAASKAETLMVVSTIATSSLEQIADVAPAGLRWFHLYVYKNRAATLELIRRVEKAGYKAIVVTVDTPVSGKRRNDERNSFTLPAHLRMENFVQQKDVKTNSNYDDAALKAMNEKGPMGSGFSSYVNSMFDSSLTWSTIDWLKSITRLPIILKGILRDDALEACKHNVSALIISNHGARQLDSVPATIEVLPEIVQAVGDRMEVYVDGGIKTGNSVFKALALGAKAVFVGRPIIWGLAYDGETGVSKILSILNEELCTTMALAGCPTVDDIRDQSHRLIVSEDYYWSKI